MSDKADVKELAVAAWRLEKWLDNLNADRKMAAKSALRSIKKYISALGIEVKDPLGSKFDPGLAVEVVNNESEDTPEEELIIVETLAPYIYQNGELVQHARVIIGSAVKEPKANSAVEEAAIVVDAEQETKANDEETPSAEAKPQPTEQDAESEIKIGSDDIERIMAYAKIL